MKPSRIFQFHQVIIVIINTLMVEQTINKQEACVNE